jgi:HAD superfamily hydrolase (TIGR01509 family)
MKKTKLRAKGIFLDLDGTMVDSAEAYNEAAKAAFAAMGLKMESANIITAIPKRLEQNIPINDLLPKTDVKRFLEIYLKAYYEATATKSKPFPNVANTLRRLSEKAKLALTTRRRVSKEQVVQELRKFGLAQYFQHVTTAMDTQNPKPSPEALIACSAELHVKTCDCLVVGDSVVDIRAGKNAGAKTVAVLTGIFSREELEMEKPDLILKNVKELPNFLE